MSGLLLIFSSPKGLVVLNGAERSSAFLPTILYSDKVMVIKAAQTQSILMMMAGKLIWITKQWKFKGMTINRNFRSKFANNRDFEVFIKYINYI